MKSDWLIWLGMGLVICLVVSVGVIECMSKGKDIGSGGLIEKVETSAGGWGSATVTTVTTTTHVIQVNGTPTVKIGDEVRFRYYKPMGKTRACFNSGRDCYRVGDM